jgi:argininosuccinate lyase
MALDLRRSSDEIDRCAPKRPPQRTRGRRAAHTTVMPGYTIQLAQPVTLAQHLASTWWMNFGTNDHFTDCLP